LEKATVKRFSSVFLKLINLTAVICILSLIADIAHPVRKSGNPNEQGKSNISNRASTNTDLSQFGSAKRATADGPITLLNTTVTNAKSTGGFVLNESGIKAESEPHRSEKTTNRQPDNSEDDAEPQRFLAKARAGGEWQSIQMRITAYCPCPKCCGQYSDGVTACGYKIQPGDTFVAADIRYPFGTEMLIPGYSNSQPVQVLDRGGAIKGNRLDVFFATHQEALEWGVKYLEVKVNHK
jgi:3D (Asp-Asp-Asp) domain-containing protein